MTSRNNEQSLAARRRAALKERQRAELRAIKERQRRQAQTVTAATAALSKVEAAEQSAAAAVAAVMATFDSAQEVADMLGIPVKRLQQFLRMRAEANHADREKPHTSAGHDFSPTAAPVSVGTAFPEQAAAEVSAPVSTPH